MEEFKSGDIVYYEDMFSTIIKCVLVSKHTSIIDEEEHPFWVVKSKKDNTNIIYLFISEINLSKDSKKYEIGVKRNEIKQKIDKLNQELSKL